MTDTDKVELVQVLDEWFVEPDDMGEEFWEEYEQQLRDNPIMI